MKTIDDVMNKLDNHADEILEKRQHRYTFAKCLFSIKSATKPVDGDLNTDKIEIPYRKYDCEVNATNLQKIEYAIECYLVNSLPHTSDSPDAEQFFHGLSAAFTDLLIKTYKNVSPDKRTCEIVRQLNRLICPGDGHGIIGTFESEGDTPSHKRYSIKTKQYYIGGSNYEQWRFSTTDESLLPDLTIYVSGQEDRHDYDEIQWNYDDFDDRYFPTGGDIVLQYLASRYRTYVNEVVFEIIKLLEDTAEFNHEI